MVDNRLTPGGRSVAATAAVLIVTAALGGAGSAGATATRTLSHSTCAVFPADNYWHVEAVDTSSLKRSSASAAVAR